jgi:acyl-CoA thioesterase I
MNEAEAGVPGLRDCTRRWFVAAVLGGIEPSVCAQAAPASVPPVVLVVGDSISAEYGLQRGSGWVALMEARMTAEKLRGRVVNASISGDTTSGGRSRLPSLLSQHKPGVVIIELGGNDALRGLPMTMTRDNLLSMTRASKSAGATVVLLGMQLPPNYGRAYGEAFAKGYAGIASDEKVRLVPFFLKGVADVEASEARFFQSDRIHPNEAAQPTMLANVWPVMSGLLKR